MAESKETVDIDYSKFGPQHPGHKLPPESNLTGPDKLPARSNGIKPNFYPSSSDSTPLSKNQSGLPDYLPEKTPLKSAKDLYPAVYGKLFSQVILPGKGEKPDSCRSWTPVFFCPNCGKPHFTKGNCKKSVCPDCETDWRFNRCQSIMERILSLKIQKKKRCRHFVVSPDSEDYPEDIEDLKELRKEVYEFAKGKGVEGGVVIFHPFRILPWKKAELWSEIESENNEFKLWKKLLEKEWSEILNCVYYAPHFHILGVGKKGNNSFESSYSGSPIENLHRIGSEKPTLVGKFIWKGIGELSNSEDLGKCSMYILSHAGVFEKSHYSSIVWFGSLSSSKWSLDRAVMKLRNGSTVKDFTTDLVEEFVSNTHEELSGSLECDNCGSGLIHIKSAPDYWENKNLKYRIELKVAYEWWRGSIPPPEGLKSESDCWEYLRKLAFEESTAAVEISRMVQGSSCLSAPISMEKIGAV